MREIILDTETTGLDPFSGHRIVEIGCIEIVNKLKTGKFFHKYINPERDMPEPAFKVHGISADFLKDKPKFKEICQEFVDFIGDSKLVIHNAPFDMKFINYELSIHEKQTISMNQAVDTLIMARKMFPGSPASLDALCKRFGVSLESREKHGALLDSELLYEVYFELCGGSQSKLSLKEKALAKNISEKKIEVPYRKFDISEQEKALHLELLSKIKEPMWSNN